MSANIRRTTLPLPCSGSRRTIGAGRAARPRRARRWSCCRRRRRSRSGSAARKSRDDLGDRRLLVEARHQDRDLGCRRSGLRRQGQPASARLECGGEAASCRPTSYRQRLAMCREQLGAERPETKPGVAKGGPCRLRRNQGVERAAKHQDQVLGLRPFLLAQEAAGQPEVGPQTCAIGRICWGR